jgi:hypothetical protein
MSHDPQEPNDVQKLSRANIRKINKLATGPLMGPVPVPPPKRATTGELVSRMAPLGAMLGVRARIARALDGDSPN